jgi:hypothetical protein
MSAKAAFFTTATDLVTSIRQSEQVDCNSATSLKTISVRMILKWNFGDEGHDE